MIRFIVAFLLLASLAFADVDKRNGVLLSTVNVNGVLLSTVNVNGQVVAGVGGGGTTPYASIDLDTFTRASIGTDYTVDGGTVDIFSGNITSATAGPSAARHNTATTTVNQWFVINMYAKDTYMPYARLRIDSSTLDHYRVAVDQSGGAIRVYSVVGWNGTATLIGSVSYTFTNSTDYVIAGNVIGTGNSTEWSVWVGVATTIPDSPTLWNSAAPLGTVTADPASPRDTGTLVGFGNTQTMAYQWGGDNFRYGYFN
jgi:hypothetical protein